MLDVSIKILKVSLVIQSILHPVILGIDFLNADKKVQVGNDQKKAQSQKESHSKN